MSHICMGFPSGSVVKNPPANAGDVKDAGLIPGSGRSPGGGRGNPLQYSFFFYIFLMWTIFKVFIEFVSILFLFNVLVFGCKVYGILAPWPGIEPAPLALEGEVLTTGPPGKSLNKHFLNE